MSRRKVEKTIFAIVTKGSLIFYISAILIVGLTVGMLIKPKHFFEALVHKEILFAVSLSLITASVTTILAILLGIPAAYTLARKDFKGKSILDTFLDLPIVLPPIVVGVLLLAFFTTPSGRLLESCGLKFVFTPLGIILAQFGVVFAVSLKFLKITFEGVDKKQETMARSLGASELVSFIKVTLPQAKAGIIGAFVLTFAKAIGEFGATIILAGATAFKTEVLSIAIFLNLAKGDIDMALCVTLILIGISMVSIFLFRKNVRVNYVRY